MIRVLLLSRPIKNAGDYLFTNKSKEVLEKVCPYVEVISAHTKQDFDIGYINSFSSIVVAGGPFYDNRFLHGVDFPLLGMLDYIEPPISFLAAGWYGEDANKHDVYGYRFSDEAIDLLRRIEKRGGISCRDDVSYQVLKNNGLSTAKMVGCTSWYDYDLIDCVNPMYTGKINRIVISDQGLTKDSRTWHWKKKVLQVVLTYINSRYENAEKVFTFNGGIDTTYSGDYNRDVCEILRKNHIKYVDISGSSDGFSVCDNCDLHVGFRVHTHIYCMSKRIPSILISEDARGTGMNQTLGTRDILEYEYINGEKSGNKNLLKELEYYIDELEECNWKLLGGSYDRMRTVYYSSMVPFLHEVCKYDEGK